MINRTILTLTLTATLAIALPHPGKAAEMPDVNAFGLGRPGIGTEFGFGDEYAFDGGGDVQLGYTRLNLPVWAKKFGEHTLSAGIRYDWDSISLDTPEFAGDLDLHRASLNVGLFKFPKTTGWINIAQVGIGIGGDLKDFNSDDFQTSVLGMVGYQFTETLGFGVAAYARYEAEEIKTYPGVGLIWRPNDHWLFFLSPPAPSIVWSPAPDWDISLSAWPAGGNWNLHDEAGVETVDLSVFRSALSVEHQLGKHLRLALRGGLALGGELELLDRNGRSVFTDDFGSGWFASAGVRWLF